MRAKTLGENLAVRNIPSIPPQNPGSTGCGMQLERLKGGRRPTTRLLHIVTRDLSKERQKVASLAWPRTLT